MPCFTPLYLSRLPDGKFSISASFKHDGYVRVGCGQCIGCMLRRSRDWAIRCVHQCLSMPENTSHFVTLTYSDENLPRHPTTGRETFEDDAVSAFMKRLRKNTGQIGVKYYACREYGERTLRPHYHICLMGLELNDYKFYRRSRDGFSLYNSEVLSTAWQDRGHVVVAPSTYETVAYTARYTTKKIGSALKPMSREYATDLLTGEIYEHLPERSYCSNRPGIGHDFFLEHHDALLSLGSTIIGNRRMPLPRYYLRKAKEIGSDLFAQYEQGRAEYYQNAEYFDDGLLLRQMHDNLILVDRMVRSVV